MCLSLLHVPFSQLFLSHLFFFFSSDPSFRLPVTVTTVPDQQGAVLDDRAGLLLWNKKAIYQKKQQQKKNTGFNVKIIQNYDTEVIYRI